MNPREKLDKSVTKDGTIVYDLNSLMENEEFYYAVRVACADLLDIPYDKIPMDAGETGEAANLILSDDTPDRFQNTFLGMEYMGKYCVRVHNDGTMVVKELEEKSKCP